MAWIFLILAGCLEVAGIMGINKVNENRSFSSYVLLIGGFGLSFMFLSIAMSSIAMGTAYAVWTGIGTVGSALLGMLFFGDSKSPLRIMFIVMVLSATVGLKLLS